jgi:hypothetical protein
MGTIGSVGIAAGMVKSSELIDWIQTRAVLEKKEAGNGKASGIGTAFSAINPMEMKNQVAYMMMMTGNPVFRNAGAMYLGYQFFGGLIGKDESNSFLAWDPLGKMPLGKLLDTVALGLLMSGNPALMATGGTWLAAHTLGNYFKEKNQQSSANTINTDLAKSATGIDYLIKQTDDKAKDIRGGFFDRMYEMPWETIALAQLEDRKKLLLRAKEMHEEKAKKEQAKQNIVNNIFLRVDKEDNMSAETKDKSIVNLFPNRNGENFTPAKNITFA